MNREQKFFDSLRDVFVGAKIEGESGYINLMRIKSRYSAGDFKAAGLDKLSSREIDALNQWLANFAQQIFQTAKGGSSGCAVVIDSQIDGTFEGWSGETIFRLTNGQVWQQSSYDYTYHYAYRPKVMIFPSGGGCKIKVEGVNNSILVKRLK